MTVCTARSRSVRVGVGEVHGQAVVERDRALGHLDEDRLDVGDLRVGQDVLRLAEEDVDELAQADRWVPGR